MRIDQGKVYLPMKLASAKGIDLSSPLLLYIIVWLTSAALYQLHLLNFLEPLNLRTSCLLFGNIGTALVIYFATRARYYRAKHYLSRRDRQAARRELGRACNVGVKYILLYALLLGAAGLWDWFQKRLPSNRVRLGDTHRQEPQNADPPAALK